MGSRHSAARQLIATGAFNRLTSFSQFEKRKESFPNSKMVGDYLEILVEGILYTHPEFNAKEVWEVGHVPARIVKKLNLPKHSSMGIDGVYEDQAGNIIPYQVKNYSSSLTVEEVATFLGVTERSLKDRVLFTNVPTVAAEITRRTGVRVVGGAFFNSLTKEDFKAFRDWLNEKPVKYQKRKPRPHQKDFINKSVRELKKNDRAQVILPCGTGKTLSALWTVTRLDKEGMLPNSTIMVLVPSLSLVQQTRKDWLREMREDMLDMCVCSDPTVAKNNDDLIGNDPKQMPFPVVTDYTVIRKFLRHKTGKLKVIFSTYHSAPVVARALDCRGIKPLDLIVYDEAHRTSGNSQFGFTLKDENIRVNKRLFMTATPKHYKISKKRLKKMGDDIEVFSMDDPKVYGNVAYRMSFKEAVDRGIIVPLKVVVSLITDQMIADYMNEKAFTNVKGENIDLRWAAAQIAHAQARKKFGIKKSISYLSRISQARDYAEHPTRSLKNYLRRGFEAYHVSSQQNSSERANILKEFAEAPYADISNARCLTEGVDLPSVDMVVFIHPRRSHVDIVQAVGRPMRTAPGKKCGYVLIPLHVQQGKGESFEEAVERTSQDGLIDIINAVREHDEDLTAIIQALRQKIGEGKPYNPSILKDKIEFLGPRVQLKTLKNAITTTMISKLSTSWDETYGRIVAYQKKFGKNKFPSTVEKGWETESTWLTRQRTLHGKGQLSASRIQRLESIGMVWDIRDEAWEFAYSLAEKYLKKYGDIPVQAVIMPDGTLKSSK